MQADGGLVEDVGDVGQRGAEVPDHLGALRLPAREAAGGPVERQVAETDLDERVEQVEQVGDQRGHAGSSMLRSHSAASVICIAHTSAMLVPLIVDDRADSLSRVPSHFGHGANTAARSTNALMCGWSESTSLLNIDLRILGIRPS